MRRVLLVCSLSLLCCAPPTPKLGNLTLPATASGFSVTRNGATLVSSSSKQAGVSTRVGKARYEMQYGSWKITDNASPWVDGTRFAWDEVTPQGATGTWRTAGNEAVSKMTVGSVLQNEVAITFTASDPATNRLSLALSCELKDRFLGFGGQVDAVDHRGHTIALWTSEPGIGKRMADDAYPDLWMLEGTRHASSFGIPTWTSNRGYQGVIGSDARSIFEVCSTDEDVFRIEVWSNTFTLFLFAGTPTEALSLATGVVLGRPLAPPPMAFAPWNDAIFGPDEVRRVAGVLRENHIPSSVIWTEDFRGGTESASDYRLKEEWDLDPTLYPDATALADELLDGGYSWQAYFNTFLVKDTRVFAAAEAGNHFVKAPDGGAYLFDGVTFEPTGLADLSREETRTWVKGYLEAALSTGFTGWMADFGEWLPHDAVLADGADPLLAHNRYAREWAKLNLEVLLAHAGDGKQKLFFSRSGWLGSNALSPVVWAGDQRTDFQPDDGLPTVVTMGINLGLAGVSTYGHDIAGYNSKTNPTSTKELFFRWTSLGALTPVMRTHHGIDARRNWRFDSDAETLAHYKRWAQFHAQLYPYLDASSAEAETGGIPIVRALAMMHPADDRAWTIADEYFFGGGLLVAPVLAQGALSRQVYLPEGEWVSWEGDVRTTGPTDIAVGATMKDLPIFLRKGACIPRLPARVETFVKASPPVVDLDDVKNERVLFVVPGGSSQFTERDGTQYVVSVTASTVFSEGTEALPDCVAAERGCIDRSGKNPVARLRNGTSMTFPGGALSIGGPVVRQIDVEVLQ